MIEFLLLMFGCLLLWIGYTQLYPFVRKQLNYRREREELVKKYNRLWKARKDMLVSSQLTYFLSRFILIGRFLEATRRGISRL